MRFIDKKLKNQPKSLILHKKKSNHNYGNYKEKQDLRESLLKEQDFLCCYCMKKIQSPTEDKMKIEHFKPFSIFNGENEKENLTLEYNNLLASCKGNENGAKHLQHCDKSKKDNEIKLNPTNKNLMDLIKFSANGLILTDNQEYDNELNNILNLNIETLKKSRKMIWESLNIVIENKFGNKTVTKSFLNEQLKKWNRKNSQGMAQEYCQVAIYYISKIMKKSI